MNVSDGALSASLGALLGSLPDDLAGELDHRRIVAISRLIQLRIAQGGDQEAADHCRRALESLSEAAAGRLLRDPALCEAVRIGEPLGDLASRIGGCDTPDGGVALRCGVRVVDGLPVRLDCPSSGLVSPRRLTAAERQAAAARCDRACDLLARHAPLGHQLLRGLRAVLVFRGDDARAAECWGATSGLAAGRIVVVNPAAAASDAHLADVLLHETVHVALDCAELQTPLLPMRDMIDPGQHVSPWTGAPLTRHAFVHAIIVWATLLQYWTRVISSPDASEAARARLDWIQAGFRRLRDQPLDLPSPAHQVIRATLGTVFVAAEGVRA